MEKHYDQYADLSQDMLTACGLHLPPQRTEPIKNHTSMLISLVYFFATTQ
jgi:hypothetical protein